MLSHHQRVPIAILARGTVAGCLVALFAFAGLLVQPVSAAEPQKTDKVAVLDAGTFVTVEAHNATLGEVLDRMGERLKISFNNTDRVDLTRIVDGRTSGSLRDVMTWLVPNGGFVMLYEERKPGDNRPAHVERIGFVAWGTQTARPGEPSSRPAKPGVASAGVPAPAARTPSGAGVTPGKAATQSADKSKEGSKPNIADTGGAGELKSVAEQLRSATTNAQLDVDRQAHDPTGQAPLPAFLQPQSDVSQTSLQQQAQRSQALAVEQLRALMGAYSAACKGTPGAPC
jgi:hypothetical protein